MGDYDRYRHGDNIEMGMGGERLGPRTTLGGSSSTTTSDFNSKSKNHQAQSEPAEDLETDYQPVNWKRVLFTPKYLVLWIVLIIIGVLTAVISLKHDQVVEALRPFAEKVRDITAGWLIFVAVLVVISFPPLFGHELVALLAGVVYGLWIGFAVVAAGTFIGESESLCSSTLHDEFRQGAISLTNHVNSWNVVRVQEGLPAEGRKDGKDQPHLWRDGEIVP